MHWFKAFKSLFILSILTTHVGLGQESIKTIIANGMKQTFVIEQVSLVDFTTHNPPVTDILVKYGRIFRIGASETWGLAPSVKRLNGRGKYLMPTLADMHYHAPGQEADPKLLQAHLFFFLAHGVTQVRIPYGHPNHPNMREEIKAGNWIGPQLWLASKPLTDHRGSLDSAQQVREAIYQAHADGFDLIKTYGFSNEALYLEAVKAAKELSMPFFGHVSKSLNLNTVINSGQAIEHFQGFSQPLKKSEALLNQWVQKAKANNIYQGPTCFWSRQYYETNAQIYQNYRGAKRMPVAFQSAWNDQREANRQTIDEASKQTYVANTQKLFSAFLKADVPMFLSGAAPEPHVVPGFSIIEGLRTFVDLGMTAQQAFQSGTHHPSTYFGLESEWGFWKTGVRADAILLGRNPLESVEHLESLEAVIYGGALLNKKLLDAGIEHHLDQMRKLKP